ncbi:MAG TPA: NUDIX hydrolase [Clostridia bacterium]|nr:NUDIX hydrolase [Clostridia bacterium]
MSSMFEKTLLRHTVFLGKILKLRVDDVELPNGHQSEREVVEHPGAVGVVALDKEGKLVLVRQYRYPVEDVLLEIPAGKIDDREEPLLCAKRELLEETGWEAENWEKIGDYYSSPGFTNERLHLYKADVTNYLGQQNDEDEHTEVVVVSVDEAVDMIRQFKIKDGKSIIGILTLKLLN